MGRGWVGTVALREAYVKLRENLIRLLAWTSDQRLWGLRIKREIPPFRSEPRDRPLL